MCIRFSVCVVMLKHPTILLYSLEAGGGLEGGYTIRDNLQHLVLSGVASLSSTQATHFVAAEVVLTVLPSHWSQLVISISL